MLALTPNAFAIADVWETPCCVVVLFYFSRGEQIRKLTYLQMLGYDMSWAAFYVIEVRFSLLLFIGIAWLFGRIKHSCSSSSSSCSRCLRVSCTNRTCMLACSVVVSHEHQAQRECAR